jgi:hypothetical protein
VSGVVVYIMTTVEVVAGSTPRYVIHFGLLFLLTCRTHVSRTCFAETHGSHMFRRKSHMALRKEHMAPGKEHMARYYKRFRSLTPKAKISLMDTEQHTSSPLAKTQEIEMDLEDQHGRLRTREYIHRFYN